MGGKRGYKGKRKDLLRSHLGGLETGSGWDSWAGRRKGPSWSADFNFERLRLGVAGGVGDGEGVGGGFGGGDVDAAGVGGPDGAGLRLEGDGFGVGDAVAELDGFAAADGAGAGIEVLDGEFVAAQLLDGLAVLLELLFGALLGGAAIDVAVIPPAGKENAGDDEQGQAQNRGGIQKRVLEDAFRFWRGYGEHGRSSSRRLGDRDESFR